MKSGHVGVKHIRDFGHVLDSEKAEMGFFLTLEPPSDQKSYPRMQILTIESLLAGDEPKRPPRRQVDATFKKAPKAKQKGPEGKELF